MAKHSSLKQKQQSFDTLDGKTNFGSKVFNYFSEFANNTGIHGFKYLGEKNRSILEKFWWLIFFAVSLYFCLELVTRTWIKWDIYPVLVSFARSPTPVWQIPFPAITICPETKSRQTIFNFTRAFHLYAQQNLTSEELKQYGTVALVCDRHLYNAGNVTAEEDTLQYLKYVAPSFEDVFHRCEWTGKEVNCRSLFTPILTEDGNCFSFNILDKSQLFTENAYFEDELVSSPIANWTLERGYAEDAQRDTYPRRALSSGASAGLFLMLKSYRNDLDYICKGPVQGFKFLLHNPSEIPRVSTHYFRAPLNQEVVVSLKPEMMTTSQGLLNYEPHRRQCFFPHERKLYFYRTYTQQNCYLECLTNWTLRHCDCVAYHMPRNQSTPICGSGNIECMYLSRNLLTSLNVESAIATKEMEIEANFTNCDCLPACTSLDYVGEHSQAEFYWKQYFNALQSGNFTTNTELLMSGIGVFFKDFQFITMERNELYGLTDFLASCGGLLGLFTGFSFLSLIEILYFLTLRLFCNICFHGSKYWYGKKRSRLLPIIPRVIIEKVLEPNDAVKPATIDLPSLKHSSDIGNDANNEHRSKVEDAEQNFSETPEKKNL